MKRGAASFAGVVAGAFAAGFVVRTIYAVRDAVKSLDRQDAELTRRFVKDELKDELRRKLESL
jgi:hypothetical protein